MGKTPYVRLTGTEVSPLDGVVEKTVDGVAVIRVVLRGIDTTLSGDRVGTARAVLITESLYVVTQFAKSSSGSTTGKAGSNNNYVIFAFISGVYQLQIEAVFVPGFFNRSGWTFSIKYHSNPLNLSECRQKLTAG